MNVKKTSVICIWTEVLDRNITLDEYEKSFSNLYIITNNTKLRDFQYCLLHKKIPTNRELFKWKLKLTNVCELCSEADGIEHTMYYCAVIKQIWEEWRHYVNTNYEVIIDIDVITSLTNDFVSNSRNIG